MVANYSRSARLHISPIGHVNLIHLRKIIHIAQKHIDLDNLCQIRASFFEDGAKIGDAFVLRPISMRGNRNPKTPGSGFGALDVNTGVLPDIVNVKFLDKDQ